MKRPTGSSSAASDGAPPEFRPVVRRRLAQRRRERRRVVAFQSGFTAVALVVLVALVWTGWSSVLRITGGSGEIVTDPEAPGYVAEVRPTDVALVAVTGDSEELVSMLVVITGAGAAQPTAVPLSPRTALWSFEDAEPASASRVFAEGGIDVLRLRLGADLGFGFTRALVVPGVRLVELARSGPLTVNLADDVLDGDLEGDAADATVRYPAGTLELEPESVDDFLAFMGYGESDPNYALRSAAVWSALLDAHRSSPSPGASALDGGDSEEFAELIATLSEAETSFEIVPMEPLALSADPPVTIYRLDPASMRAWTADHVHFPVAAHPGQLVTVAVLDGSGAGADAALGAVARDIVGIGGEISLSGNARSFDVSTTRVEYHRPEAKSAAGDIASALGVVATDAEEARTDVDVSVIVGKDLAT